ncbi:hypothetical protein L6164_022151 [Bauhinia variegata]|uniref:Uncharacterized protein n=1 Tax=Bauhinia variegata TaxID=167791 RepID=A0ACB9MFM6_BAUVA|nr:hypothetical protein L6164_022151 [Bauhinia variegata]
MSKRGGSSRLELRLNLSPSPSTAREANLSSLEDSAEFSTSSILSYSSEMTVEGSCVSSKAEEQQQETRAMLLVGCPRCLMYVMLSVVNPDPKCPKCKSTVLLDFLNQEKNCKNKQDDAP